MFDFLKKKIASWIKPKKEKKEKKKNEKKKSTKKVEKSKKNEKKIETKIEETSAPPIEEIKEETISEEKEEKPNFFSRLFNKITSSKLSQEDFNSIFEEFEIVLLENNVAVEAIDAIRKSLSEQLVGQQMKKNEANEKILSALKESILSILSEPPSLLELIKNKKSKEPFTIIFFGINGTGKTTSIAKIATLLRKNNISSVLSASDTFRAASIEQLKIHAEKISVPIVSHQYGSDPAAVAFDAKKYARTHNIQVVLIDTAGRMYTKQNLIKEMEKIIRVSAPDLKIFVGESITGNDMIDQAKTFNEAIGIDGVILSKADIDEKAGAILSVSHITKKPIYFLGTGQNYEDLTPFTKKEVLKNLGLE